jgi:hypothetical protein
MILRTAWIYSAHGQNLVKAICGSRLSTRECASSPTSSRTAMRARGTFHF